MLNSELKVQECDMVRGEIFKDGIILRMTNNQLIDGLIA